MNQSTPINDPKDISTRIIIQVTRGSLNNSYPSIRGHENFFPGSAYGSSNRNTGEGKKIKLHVAGRGDVIKTDLDDEKLLFRARGWCREFYGLYKLEIGDEVVIEKINDYEYLVYPRAK